MNRVRAGTGALAVASALICAALAVNGCMQPSQEWDWDRALSEMRPQFVTAVALSADAEEVAAGTMDGSVYVWSLPTGELKAQLPPPGSPVQYYQVGSGTNRHRCGVRGHFVDWVAFSPGTKDILAGVGGRLRILERQTGTVREVRVALAPRERVSMSALSHNHRYVAGGVRKHTALWDARTGERLRTFGPHHSGVTLVSISPSTQYVLAASLESVRVWDTTSANAVCTLDGESTGHVRCAAWSPDERRFITVSAKGQVKVWDLLSRRELVSCDAGMRFPLPGLQICAGSPDGTLILLVGPKALLFDTDSGNEVRRLGDDQDKFVVGRFSPDGRHVVTGECGRITLWETKTGHEVRQFIVPATE